MGGARDNLHQCVCLTKSWKLRLSFSFVLLTVFDNFKTVVDLQVLLSHKQYSKMSLTCVLCEFTPRDRFFRWKGSEPHIICGECLDEPGKKNKISLEYKICINVLD